VLICSFSDESNISYSDNCDELDISAKNDQVFYNYKSVDLFIDQAIRRVKSFI